MSEKTIKCFLIGDSGVGKSTIILSCENAESVAFSNAENGFTQYQVVAVANNDHYKLLLSDCGGDDNKDLRTATYSTVDMIVICFSVDNLTSFINVKEKWEPEFRLHTSKTPFVLLGTKTDLRNDLNVIDRLAMEGKTTISEEQGQKMAQELDAEKYVECTTTKKNGVKQLIDELVSISNSNSMKKRKVLMRNLSAISGNNASDNQNQCINRNKCCRAICSNTQNCVIT